MAAPQRTKRRYGLPWAGYQSSTKPHLVAPDKATSDGPSSSRASFNFLYSPLDGTFYRRAGSAYVGGTSGILENGTGELTVSRARQLVALRSPSLTDAYPTHAILFTEEGATPKGVVYFRNTNNSDTNQSLGSEFGTTQYPTAIGSPSYQKSLPYMRTTDGTIGRFNTLALRGLVAAGSRRMLEVGDWLFLPNKDGTPVRWNKSFNDSNADTTYVMRVAHTGSPSPLGMPTITTGTINPVGSWHEGDAFYVSVAYRFADGSVSMPSIPRDRNANLNYAANGNHTGLGKISLERSSVPANDRYYDLTWRAIPIGPDGCIGRYLLRTPKLVGTSDTAGVAGTEGSEPSPLDLRITAYLSNNTQTEYEDPNGNDLSLISDPLLVRFDHIMQPPARYIGTCDGRVVVGYTKPNPVAIYLCPNVNAIDTSTTLDDRIYDYTLTGGTLTLREDGAPPATITITNIGTKSVQRVVDEINNTSASVGSGGKWWAQVAPGADSSAPCDGAGTAAANSNLTSVTAGTETGDASGKIRGYSPSFPACIFFSTTYLANFPTNKRQVAFTMGGPGMPKAAANSWAAGNLRSAPSDLWGDYMGSAPLRSGAVLCFSKAIGTLENRKGGTSGLDDDYTIYDLNVGRGCIAWDSVVEFNGAVGYMTADGYVVTDGREEVVISGDVWNSGSQTGEWAYEITQSLAGVSADTDLSHFHAKVMGGKLYITYRLTSGTNYPDRMLVYDFTGSSQYSGIRGVLGPEGRPWGWSTPLKPAVTLGAAGGESWGVMGEVVNASGILRYAVDDNPAHSGMTSNGTVFQIETGTLDDSVQVLSNLWTSRDIADHLKNKSAQEATLIYKIAGAGLTLKGYRDGLGTTADVSLTIPTSGASTNFAILPLPMPMAMRSGAKSVEWLIADEGSATDPAKIWGLETDLLLLESYL